MYRGDRSVIDPVKFTFEQGINLPNNAIINEVNNQFNDDAEEDGTEEYQSDIDIDTNTNNTINVLNPTRILYLLPD